jgi:hypothetical protein
MSAERQVVTFPTTPRALPTPADLDRISRLPLVQMFVVGRSGSGLVHAFLDGHPEVLHVPHTFKFYDFVAANPDLLSAEPRVVAERFSGSPLVASLFDSSRSVIIGGRLGPGMQTFVRVDEGRFCEAFASAMTEPAGTWRRLFAGILVAYGWAIGQDLTRARVMFHHVHHGDWLWPERLIEQANAPATLPSPPADVLKADKFVVSLREPHDACMAYIRFIDGQKLGDPSRLNFQEQFTRLLLQDWDRLTFLERSGANTFVARLEDLRNDSAGVMCRCADWLGIDSSEAALLGLTYYGYEWFGDIYTPPSSTVHSVRPKPSLDWQDRWLCDAVLARPAEAHGYTHRGFVAAKVALLWLTVVFPSARLRDTSLAGWWPQVQSAMARAVARVRFAHIMRERMA